MDRGMLGNWHVPCGAGEKPEITSNAYLLLTLIQEGLPAFFVESLLSSNDAGLVQ